MPPDVGVVIAAGGRGERIGGGTPKQFRELAGTPLLLHAIRPFLARPDVARVVVVLPAATGTPSWLRDLAPGRLGVVPGGPQRMDSVEAGLRALPPDCQVVLVHDGARPFPDPDVIDAVIRHARAGVGALAAVPLTDTLKESCDVGEVGMVRVARTLRRDRLWRAQTPQGFPREMLEGAYRAARRAGYAGTDEASLVEQQGGTVLLVPDCSTNLKVTTPADFELAAALAGRPE